MTTNNWRDKEVTVFLDDFETVYTRGPFKFNNTSYDYKLQDKYGEDYCTIDQMVMWNVELTKDLS